MKCSFVLQYMKYQSRYMMKCVANLTDEIYFFCSILKTTAWIGSVELKQKARFRYLYDRNHSITAKKIVLAMTRFLCDLVICILVPNVCLFKSTLTHLLKQIVDLTGLTQSDIKLITPINNNKFLCIWDWTDWIDHSPCTWTCMLGPAQSPRCQTACQASWSSSWRRRPRWAGRGSPARCAWCSRRCRPVHPWIALSPQPCAHSGLPRNEMRQLNLLQSRVKIHGIHSLIQQNRYYGISRNIQQYIGDRLIVNLS